MMSYYNGQKQPPFTILCLWYYFCPKRFNFRFFFRPDFSDGNLGQRYHYAFMGHGDFILYSNTELKFEVKKVPLFYMT